MKNQNHAIRRNFTDSGAVALPVSDTSFETEVIPVDNSLSEVYIEFFSDESLDIPVTPTSGTITVTASPLGNCYLEASFDAVINAEDVSFPNASYSPPIIDGLVRKARITFSGITGASYARAIIYTHD